MRPFFDGVRNLRKLAALDERGFVRKAIELANTFGEIEGIMARMQKKSNEEKPDGLFQRAKPPVLTELLTAQSARLGRIINELNLGASAPGAANVGFGMVAFAAGFGDISAFVADLDRMAKSYRRARPAILTQLNAFPEVALMPSLIVEDGNPKVRYRFFPRNLAAALDFARLLLADESAGFGKDLCRCTFEDCGEFFLSVPNPSGGPRRRKYCSPEHMKEEHNRDAKNRVARMRAANRRKGAARTQ